MKKTGRMLRKEGRSVYLSYTILFACFAAFIFCGFFLPYGKSLICGADGVNQHLMTLTYCGEYLRSILKNLFVEHRLSIPMFDFSIGYGSDIIQTLHYYGFGDPLNLLSVFVPAAYTEYLYGVLIVLRMFLAGITFICFMRTKKNEPLPLVLGAITYAFCSYVLMLGFKHPLFCTGLIYAPLVFLGIDRVLEEKSPALFIFSLALAVLSNFYFGYMICIYMVLYAAAVYLGGYRRRGVGHFFKTVGKFALFSVNALMIPAIVFLPQVVNILGLYRINADHYVGVFHALSYYKSLFGAFLRTSAVGNAGRDMYLGFTGVALLCFFAALLRPKKNKTLLFGFGVSLLFAIFPFFGSVLNGFSYVSNRWCWIVTLLVSAGLTLNFDELFALNEKEQRMLLLLTGVYAVCVCLLPASTNAIALAMLAAAFAALVIVGRKQKETMDPLRARRAVACLVLLCLALQIYQLFSMNGQNFLTQFMDIGTAYKYTGEQSVSSAIKEKSEEDGFYRYDNLTIAGENSDIYNDAMLSDSNSTSFFFSMSNHNVSDFLRQISLNTSLEYIYPNTGNRLILQYLTGARYIAGLDVGLNEFYSPVGKVTLEYEANIRGDDLGLGYMRGVENIGAADGDTSYTIMESDDVLPMGYTYDSVYPAEEYEKLNSIQKQNVFLQAAVTDTQLPLPTAAIRTDDVQTVDVLGRAATDAGIEIRENAIVVSEPNSSMVLHVPMQNMSEFYILWNGFDFEPYSKYDYIQSLSDRRASQVESGKGLNKLSEKLLKQKKRNEQRQESVHVEFSSRVPFCAESILYRTKYGMYYSGNDSFAVNIGYVPSEELAGDIEEGEIMVTFQDMGVYSFDSLVGVTQSVAHIREDARQRKQSILENVQIDDNYVGGTISLESPKLLATQIPYSDGWRVSVDGEEAELVQVNSMFCGVMLQPGDHSVEFHYRTPYMGTALILTCGGLLLAAGTLTVCRLSRKKRAAADEAGEEKNDVAID